MIPKFIEIKNAGDASAVPGFFVNNHLGLHLNLLFILYHFRLQFLSLIKILESYRNVSIQLKTDEHNKYTKWWEVKEVFNEVVDKAKLSQVPHYENKGIMIYTFNEKNMPKMFQFFQKRG